MFVCGAGGSRTHVLQVSKILSTSLVILFNTSPQEQLTNLKFEVWVIFTRLTSNSTNDVIWGSNCLTPIMQQHEQCYGLMQVHIELIL